MENDLFVIIEKIFLLMINNVDEMRIVKEYLIFENTILNIVGTGIIFDNLCKSDVNRMCFVNYPRLKRLVFHKISMSVEEFRIENCDELIDIQLCKDSEDNEKEEDDKEMPSFILYNFIGFINPDNDRKFKINCNTCKLISNYIL